MNPLCPINQIGIRHPDIHVVMYICMKKNVYKDG